MGDDILWDVYSLLTILVVAATALLFTCIGAYHVFQGFGAKKKLVRNRS
jgi:hypothetical protein